MLINDEGIKSDYFDARIFIYHSSFGWNVDLVSKGTVTKLYIERIIWKNWKNTLYGVGKKIKTWPRNALLLVRFYRSWRRSIAGTLSSLTTPFFTKSEQYWCISWPCSDFMTFSCRKNCENGEKSAFFSTQKFTKMSKIKTWPRNGSILLGFRKKWWP